MNGQQTLEFQWGYFIFVRTKHYLCVCFVYFDILLWLDDFKLALV